MQVLSDPTKKPLLTRNMSTVLIQLFVASVEQGLTTAVSIFSIFLSQWFTSVIVLLFITFWKQEDKESAMDDIEEFTLEPILCLRHQNLELTKNNEKLQITILKEQVSTLQRKLAAVEEELEKIKNENKQFHLISLKGNMLIDNFRKTTKQFFNARCITVTERKADIIDEKQSEIAAQTSDECITQYDSIPNLTSLEDQTYTNKIIVNDLAGYKRLTPDQYVCINDGQVVFENIPEEINTQVILRTEPVKREEKCLENIYRMVWEQDSSETDSIGEVINPDDLQMFRKKFNDFCKLIPAMRFSSSSNLSTTTSEAETFDSSDYASDKTSCFAETTNLQVLYKPSQTSVICDSTIDYMKAMDGTNMGELMTRAISEDDMISALRVWNTSVKY